MRKRPRTVSEDTMRKRRSSSGFSKNFRTVSERKFKKQRIQKREKNKIGEPVGEKNVGEDVEEDVGEDVEAEDFGEKNVGGDVEGEDVENVGEDVEDVGEEKDDKTPTWFLKFLENDFKGLKTDMAGMKRLNGKIFEQQLYQHAGRTLGRISLSYDSLKFRPLDHHSKFQLETYLSQALTVSWGKTIGTIDFSWLENYHHANIKGKIIPLDTYNFNLVSPPIYSPDGKTGAHFVIGEVKVEGSVHHFSKGFLQCAQLAGLVLETVWQAKQKEEKLKDSPHLNVSFFLFIICGYFDVGFPKPMCGKQVTSKNFNDIDNFCGVLNLDVEKIGFYDCDFPREGVSSLWNCFVNSTYQEKTLNDMYLEQLPDYDVINSFTLYLLIRIFNPHNVKFQFLEGQL